jgi:hypothetical protein
VLCVSVYAQEEVPPINQWRVLLGAERDDTRYYNVLLFNARGGWPARVVNVEVPQLGTTANQYPVVEGIVITNIEVTCGGGATGPDGSPMVRYRYDFALPEIYGQHFFSFKLRKRCIGDTGPFIPIEPTLSQASAVFSSTLSPPPDGLTIGIFPERPLPNQPFVLAFPNTVCEYADGPIEISPPWIRFFVTGNCDEGIAAAAERPIRRTITLPAGNYVAVKSEFLPGGGFANSYGLPFTIQGPILARPLPSLGTSMTGILLIMILAIGLFFLRKS